MQVPDNHQNPPETFHAADFARAIRIGNLRECLRLSEAAGAQRSGQAVPYLAALLQRKERWHETLDSTRPMRRRIKSAAVASLRQIGNLASAEALTVGLFDSEEGIGRMAASALVSFGGQAVPPLLQILERRSRWTVPQMRLLIETLGEIGDPRSGPALARVLLGFHPHESSRWFRKTALFPALFSVSAVTLASVLMIIINSVTEERTLPFYLNCLAFCLVVGPLVGMFLFMPFFFLVLLPVALAWANNERAALAESAATVLTGLRDKRSLPSVIEAAYAGRRKSQPAARRALCHLLPLLTEADADLLPKASIHLLLDSLQPITQALAPQAPDLVVAVVGALRQVGPGSAVEAVRKLGKRSDAPQVRIACREALPFLQARRDLELASASLLRASALPAVPSSQLLRPASAVPESNPQELLRPAE